MTTSAQNSKQVLSQQGSATVPSFSFLGAGTNGFYLSGTNKVSIATNGTQAVTVDATQQVGIGTASPAAKLDLASGNLLFSSTAQRITGDFSNVTVANRVNFQTSTTNGATYVSTLPVGTGTASGFFSYNAADGDNASYLGSYLTSSVSVINSGKTGTGTYLPMTFYTGGSERMRIDSSGNVGIGTSSSSYPLTVRTSGTSTTVGGNIGLRVESNGSGYASTLQFSDNVANSSSISMIGSATAFLQAGTEAMRITSAGNVGIGSTAPNLSSSSTALTINTGTAANYSAMELASGGTLNFYINANNAASYIASAGTRPMVFYTNSSERMRIDSSGNVGIGTSSPAWRFTSVGGSVQLSPGTSAQEGVRLSRSTGVMTFNGINNDNNAYNALAFATSASEAMRIDSSGNVGIGDPCSNVNDQVGSVRPLLVAGSSTSTTVAGSTASLVVANKDTTTSNTSQLSFATLTPSNGTYFTSAAINCIFGARTTGQYPTGQLTFAVSKALNSAPTEVARIDTSGNFLVGRTDNPSGLSNSLYVTGAYSNTTPSGANVFVNTDGSFFRSTSSLKYKTDIKEYSRGLSDVAKLRPVFYKAKESLNANQQFAGFIAEEIQAAGLTEFVQYAEDGSPDALSYGNMVALCIKAIQELSAKVAALEGKK
jgi:hypothetical protein